MEKLISWLSKYKPVTIILSFAFYLSVVLLHDVITDIAIEVRRSMGVDGYNLLFTVISLVFLALLLGYSLLQIRKGSFKSQKSLLLTVTILLIVAFYLFAMVYNIEAVHFGQYLILAILLFPLIKSYGETVFWVTMLGIIDELYQYIVLVPFFKYFDLNDIILNLLGAGLGVVLIFISTEYVSKRKINWKTPSVIFTTLIAIMLLLLFFTGEFTLYPVDDISESTPWITLNRDVIPSGFWTRAYEGRYYHVVRPGEGVIILYILFTFYYLIDYIPAGKKK